MTQLISLEESRIELLAAAVRNLMFNGGSSPSPSLFLLGVKRTKETLTPAARAFAEGEIFGRIFKDLATAASKELGSELNRARRYHNIEN